MSSLTKKAKPKPSNLTVAKIAARPKLHKPPADAKPIASFFAAEPDSNFCSVVPNKWVISFKDLYLCNFDPFSK